MRLWGRARPGEKIQAAFNGQAAGAVADQQGRWLVELKAEPAGGPYALTIKGDNVVTLADVVVGEVWLASGQSNMELSVADSSDAAVEVARSGFPLIRHFKVPKALAYQPAADLGEESGWKVSGPKNTGSFSAAGYFFARKIHQETGVPVGILNASWGGSNLETWLSPEAFLADPELNTDPIPPDLASFQARNRARVKAMLAKWQPGSEPAGPDAVAAWKETELDDSSWPSLQAPQYWEEQGLEGFDGIVWYRRAVYLTKEQAGSEAVLQPGRIDDCDETYLNGARLGGECSWDKIRLYAVPRNLLKPGKNIVAIRVTDTGGGGGLHGDAEILKLQLGAASVSLAGEWKARVESFPDRKLPAPNDLPSLAFNGMLRPIADFPVRGALWYQGESNVERAAQYIRTFPLLIEDIRKQWKQPGMPFYFVQLASFQPPERNTLDGSAWAELREAQRLALKLPGTGMVVATDIGDANDIHPRNKQAVGLRLALHALKDQYEKKVAASGPLYKEMRVRGSEIEISFTETGGGLVAANRNDLRGFAVADESRKFMPARARIDGDKVIVSNPAVAGPKAVRYGWMDNPGENDLFDLEGLPASPFRTDDWPLRTAGVKYSY